MKYFLFLFFIGLLGSASHGAPAEKKKCTPCPRTVNITQPCGTKLWKELKGRYSCGDITDNQDGIPFKNSTACKFDNAKQMPAVATCRSNRKVSCEPCCSSSCPPNESVVSGNP